MLIGYEEDFYKNPLFEFETILEDPSNISSIQELINYAVEKEIDDKNIVDTDYFPSNTNSTI